MRRLQINTLHNRDGTRHSMHTHSQKIIPLLWGQPYSLKLYAHDIFIIKYCLLVKLARAEVRCQHGN